MTDKNFIILEGVIIENPEIKTSEKGKQYCNFSLRNTISKKINNEWNCEPYDFPVRIWENALHWHAILKKSMYIVVMGKIHNDNGIIHIIGERIERLL